MRSFYLKLAVIFSGLLIAFGLLVAYTSTKASLGYVQETTQKSNATLARTLAQEFRPLLKDTIDHDAIRSKIQQLSGTNPQFDIYLLNRQGVIKGSYPGSGENNSTPVTQVVDLRPIDRYLSGDPLPILGQDPLQNNSSNHLVQHLSALEIPRAATSILSLKANSTIRRQQWCQTVISLAIRCGSWELFC